MQKQRKAPSYRLHKPSGQAVVTIEGRDHYLGAFDSPLSHEAYGRKIAEWKAATIAAASQGQQLSVAGMVAEYWRHVEASGLYVKNGKATSERSCLAVALRPLVRLFGSMPAATFGPRDLVTVRTALCSPLPAPGEGERGRRVHVQPITRKSVNAHVHRIRRVFRWAASMQVIPASTWQGLLALEALRRGQASGTREAGKVRPAPVRSVAKVLRTVDGDVAACIRLQWLCGMRPGEVVQMRTADIDRSGQVWRYRPTSHKNEHRDQEREILLGPRAQRVLAPFLRLDPAAWLFPSVNRASHLREDRYARTIARACAEAGVEHWAPNQLRHSAATRFRKVYGIEAAGILLGHADESTVTTIYAEPDKKAAMAVAMRAC